MIKEYVDFIDGNVLRQAHGYDCTNGGASSRYNRLYVVKEHVTLEDVEELCENNDMYKADMFFKVDYKFQKLDNFGNYVRLRPIANKGGAMAGGNYLTSCDSRFKEFVCGCQYPVPIHDRFE